MPGESEWTIATLHEHYATRLNEMDLRHQQRFDAQSKAIDAALEAQRAATAASLASVDKATALASSISKDKFESVNEFRGALSDLTATLMSRAEGVAMIERNSERISEVLKRMDNFAARDAVLTEYDRLSAQLNSLSERVTRGEGKGSGLTAGWGYIIGAVGLITAIVAMYLNLRGAG